MSSSNIKQIPETLSVFVSPAFQPSRVPKHNVHCHKQDPAKIVLKRLWFM
jgi:hypothetical protein